MKKKTEKILRKRILSEVRRRSRLLFKNRIRGGQVMADRRRKRPKHCLRERQSWED